jgi:hypothetical protein
MIATLLVALALATSPRAGTADTASSTAPIAPAPADTLPTARRDQQPTLDPSRFDSLTILTLRALIDSAAHNGIPVAPLVNRALEGAARRAPGPRIVAVVRAHASALADARDALGPAATVAELDAGAMALRAGVDGAALAAVRRQRPAGQAVTPLVVLTDVVRRGVPLAAARDAVTAVAPLARGDELLLGLQETVARGAARGGSGMALDAMQRYLRNSVPGAERAPAPASTRRPPPDPPTP